MTLRIVFTFCVFSAIFFGSSVAELANVDPDPDDIRQGVYTELVKKTNQMISKEYVSMYAYEIIATSLSYLKTAKLGFAKYFRKMSDKATELSRDLQEYLNSRGASVTFQSLSSPQSPKTWNNGEEALRWAIKDQIDLNTEYIALAKMCDDDKSRDPQFADYLQRKMLVEKVSQIEDLRVLLSRWEQLNATMGKSGEFFLDQELRGRK